MLLLQVQVRELVLPQALLLPLVLVLVLPLLAELLLAQLLLLPRLDLGSPLASPKTCHQWWHCSSTWRHCPHRRRLPSLTWFDTQQTKSVWSTAKLCM